jgi:DNA-binding CsgD family transcriptional regulator
MHCSTEQLVVAGRLGQLAGAGPEPGRTDDALELLQPACRYEAANLVRWDAARGSHVGLANHHYDDDLHRYFVDEFPATVASVRIQNGRVPLRIDDAPYDFRESQTYLEYLQPRGYQDGLTAALFLDDDQYVGMLHMSSGDKHQFDNDVRDYVAALAPLMAGIVAAAPIAGAMGDPAVVNWSGGDEPPVTIVRAAQRFMLGRSASLTALWHHAGVWQQIDFTRSPSASCGVHVSAAPHDVPYALTRRELQVATAVASGLTNKTIASFLRISPRTVGKHVERVLDKLDCDSRSHAASMCVQEGIIDLELIVAGPQCSRLLHHEGSPEYVT